MRRGRLLLPWGLLAGLLLWAAAIEGLNIKAPSLLKKPRTVINSSTASSTTTTTTTTEQAELQEEAAEDEEPTAGAEVAEGAEAANTTNSRLTGDPQKDYRYDPNLPRELPIGYNLSSYPFFSRVPNDVTFECGDDLLDGYYANVHYKCQVYHHCLSGIRYDFLCANYTAFDQKTFICHFVSEVDCANSAKFWNRNKGLYETPTTTTVKPLTTAPPPTAAPSPARRPAAGAAGRRRRPFRRRRPQYDYYYDEEYDDEEYEDDLTGPAQSVGRGAGGSPRARPSSSEAPTDDKPFKADKSIYDRPRQAPQIRRPVPLSERDKYAAKDAEKRPKDDGDRQPSQDREPDRKRTQDSSDLDKPSRPRQKPRPSSDDDEYYDDDDYEQPRTPSRKQHGHSQDYYGATGEDRDFVRRPAMSGQGRPLRRNRPGARRKQVDDDYYDDDRRSRPSASDSDSRRRPQPDRRRPMADDAPRRRPSEDDEPRRRRPADYDSGSSRKRGDDDRRRPAVDEDDVVVRKRPVDDDVPPRRRPLDDEEPPRRKPVEDVPPRRRPLDDEVPPRRKPADEEVPQRKRPHDDEVPPRRRPLDDEAPARRKPVEEDIPPRKRPLDDELPARRKPVEEDVPPRRRPLDDEVPSRRRPVEEEVPARRRPSDDESRRPAASSRKRGPQRDEYERETSYERSASRESPTHRELDPVVPARGPAKERPRAAPLPASEIPLSTYSRETTPRSRGLPEQTSARTRDALDDRRPLTAPSGGARTRQEDADYEPIPAAKPAYISTTGRGSTTHRKALEDEVRIPPTGTASRGNQRTASRTTTTTTTTEAPLLDDEEYYDDDEEVEEELPSRPTGPGNGNQPATSTPRPDAVTASRARPTGREESFPEDKATASSAGSRRPDRVGVDVRQGGKETEAGADPAPTKHSSSSSYRFNEDGVLLETLPARPGFRPKVTTTTQVYQYPTTEQPVEQVHQRPAYQSNYRRKGNPGGVDASKDEVRGVSQDVHIPPSGPETYAPTESSVQTTEAPIRLETEAFAVTKPTYGSLPPTGPSGRGNYHFRKNTPRPVDDYPRQPVLPDITDPEYDVTLNEAIHPTPLPFSSESAPRIKVKVPLYNYRDGDFPSAKKGSTLVSSASQTHEAKAPFPLHDKVADEEYENATEEDDYEDLPIPTGKGAEVPRAEDVAIPTGRGSTGRGYDWTTSNPMEFRGSEGSLPPNQATTSQQYYVNSQQTQQPPLQQQQKLPPARGSLREFEQQIYVPTRNANQQYYKAAGADLYRGSLNPLLFSQGYDYDLTPKFRPRRKYFSRDVHDYFGKLY